MKSISYEGQNVSAGIDVHVSTYHVTCVMAGVVVKRSSMRAEPEVALSFLVNHFPGARIQAVYEAGFSGFELQRHLAAGGVKCGVVNASSIEVASKDRVKTDKIDSRKLAEQLDRGQLKFIRVPSREEEAMRVLHRTRQQLVKKRSAIMAQIRMRFYQFGIRVTKANEQLTFKKVEESLDLENLRSEVKLSIRTLVSIWKSLNAEIRLLESEQKKQADEDIRTAVYLSVPGYGFQTTRILSTELGDMSQFNNERALFCFTGLTPSEWSTGENIRKGHISRQGSARLRHVLIEAAWNAVRYNAEVKRNFEKLANRIGKKRAIVAIARKLLGRARALFRKGEQYRSQRALKRAA